MHLLQPRPREEGGPGSCLPVASDYCWVLLSACSPAVVQGLLVLPAEQGLLPTMGFGVSPPCWWTSLCCRCWGAANPRCELLEPVSWRSLAEPDSWMRFISLSFNPSAVLWLVLTEAGAEASGPAPSPSAASLPLRACPPAAATARRAPVLSFQVGAR